MADVNARNVNALYEALAVIRDEHGADVTNRLAKELLARLDRRSPGAVEHDQRRRDDWRGDGDEPPPPEFNAAAFSPDCGHASHSDCTETCRRAGIAGQVHLARIELGLEDPAPGPVTKNAPIRQKHADERLASRASREAQLRGLVKLAVDTAHRAEELGFGEATLRSAHAVLKAARGHLRELAGEAPLFREGRPPKHDAERVGIVRRALEDAGVPSGDVDAAGLIYGQPNGGGRNDDGKLTITVARRANRIRGQRRRHTTP